MILPLNSPLNSPSEAIEYRKLLPILFTRASLRKYFGIEYEAYQYLHWQARRKVRRQIAVAIFLAYKERPRMNNVSLVHNKLVREGYTVLYLDLTIDIVDWIKDLARERRCFPVDLVLGWVEEFNKRGLSKKQVLELVNECDCLIQKEKTSFGIKAPTCRWGCKK